MDLVTILQVLLMCSLFVSHNGVEGGWSLSEEEDLLVEKQLKILNKPSVKTIETDYGDIYNCVDFYKQPAFDHPLLKNHSFHHQMKPTSLLKQTKQTNDGASTKVIEPTKFPGGGCPIGTVPIRRITKEDLIRERLASRIIMPLEDEDKNTHAVNLAVVRTKASASRYRGAGAQYSIHNPIARGRQYSAARIKLQNGADRIEVGWRVDHTTYGDNNTRAFIRLDAGQSHCFNTRCPGFVIVDTRYALDAVLSPISKPGGLAYVVEAYIIRDEPLGNWWLQLGKDHVPIGFWPNKLFKGLSGMASNIDWGGEAFSLPGQRSPPMGAGYFPQDDTRYDAFFAKMTVIDERHQTLDASNTEEFAIDNRFFGAKDKGFVKKDNFRHLGLYGGPGGGP